MPALQRRVTRRPRLLNFGIKLAVTVVLFLLIGHNVDLEESLASISLLSAKAMLLALALQLASNSVAGYRWYLIMRRIGSRSNALFFLRSYFKGTFFNQGLPTSIGGDAIRILDCTDSGHTAMDSFYGVLIHLLAMTAFYVLGANVGLNYPLNVYLVLVPPVVLLTILPISLAGWGVREGAMIGFFLLVGADHSRVLTFSVLYGLLALTSSLPGLLVYLTQKDGV